MGSNIARHGAAAKLYSTKRAAPGWKRALDLSLLLLLSPVLLLPLLMICCFIKVVSRGPVLFAQQRIGYRGRPFTLWKLRTMHVGNDPTTHRQYTRTLIQGGDVPMEKLDLAGDPRLIRFGGSLRASGFDELPQLLNVFFGEMSLVGPRPCVPYEYEHYTAAQKRRLDTLPGLTGLWQVSGKNHTTFSEMIALDLEYVERRSLWLDLSILARTFPTVLSQITEFYFRRLASLRSRA